MPIRIHPARTSLSSRASNGDARPDDRLALPDQAWFAAHRAAGQKEVMQVVWVYERAIDFDGLRRFHHNLGDGLLGRRIERSPLPFARHRWVSDRRPSEIDIADCARPRAELSDWVDERSELPADPERGPGWHLGVLPLTDGSTAVSLVASHYLLDGLGFMGAIVEALWGNTRDLGYPPPRSRTRLRAVIQDARQTARDTPEIARALVTAAKLARRRQLDVVRPSASRPVAQRGADGDDLVVMPGITICIGLDDWDARAKALGGTSNTLAAGFAAKLGERIGRCRAGDGAVTVQLPISERAEGDTRALALSYARVSIDPRRVTTDLRDARAAIKQALNTSQETPDESLQLAWLAPFTPKRTLKRAVDLASVDPDHPVVCSNLGDVGSVVGWVDGTHCDMGYARGTRQHATRQSLERAGGQLQLLTFRTPVLHKFFIHVLGYQPGAENTKPGLRELAAHALAEFGLNGEIE